MENCKEQGEGENRSHNCVANDESFGQKGCRHQFVRSRGISEEEQGDMLSMFLRCMPSNTCPLDCKKDIWICGQTGGEKYRYKIRWIILTNV